MFALTVPDPARPAAPVLVDPPPYPPAALKSMKSKLAPPSKYGVVVPSVELALPPAPAAPVSLEPPLPPVLLWLRLSVAVVMPMTAFVTADVAPAPPAAPE